MSAEPHDGTPQVGPRSSATVHSPLAAGANGRMARALADFREAAAGRKPDGICTAYQTLRDAAGGLRVGELLRIAGETLDRDAAALIVSAYSHRRCFMCLGGTVSCDHCHGSGQVAKDRPCPHCDGIGLAACGFCGGTGWADRSSVPPEIVSAVLARQVARTRSDLKRLAQTAAGLTPERIRLLDTDHRKYLAAWMMRLQARLLDLARTEAVDDEQEAHFGALAGKINACLNLLRNTG